MITLKEVIERLPDTVECNYDIYLVGSAIKNKICDKDIDLLIIEKLDKSKNIELTTYFINTLHYRIHLITGTEIKNEFYIKVYSNKQKLNVNSIIENN